MKKSHVVAVGLGAILVIVGIVDRLAVYPSLHKVPANLDTVVHYDGTATLLDPAALQAGRFDQSMLMTMPITAVETVQGSHATSDALIVTDDILVTGPKSMQIARPHHNWAVSRSTMMAVPAPAGQTGEPHQGLVIGFPLQPQPRTYTFWDTGTQRPYRLDYVRTGTFAGRKAFRYHMVANGPLADPTTRKALPPALPSAALPALRAQVHDVAAPLPAGLPAVAPVDYFARTDLSFWVDASSGVVLQTAENQQVAAAPQTDTAVRAPVSTITLTTTADSSKSLADTAKKAGLVFWALGDGVPYVFIILGALIIIGILLLRYRQKSRRVTG